MGTVREEDFINILGQNLPIWGLIIFCVVMGLIFISILIAIITISIFNNYHKKNSNWKKFKIEKIIYETEEQITKMIMILENNKHKAGNNNVMERKGSR